jgi:hypothetical protein
MILKIVCLFLTFSLFEISAFADGALMSSGTSSLLKDIRSEAKRCVSSEQTGSDALSFKSVCPSIRLISNTQAQVLVGQQWYTAEIQVSVDADEGDLNNLRIYNSNGQSVAQRSNVLAYSNIVYALLGGAKNYERP